MQLFSKLFTELDNTTKTNEKIEALVSYFREAPEQDRVWAIGLFTGRNPKRPVNSTLLKLWAQEEAGIPQWLFDEAYHSAGDLAETISLILPAPTTKLDKTLTQWIEYIDSISKVSDLQKRTMITDAWEGLERQERFVFCKLITSGFRVGVSQSLVIRALAQLTETEPSYITHCLMGSWDPRTTTYTQLIEQNEAEFSQPYPFYLAYPLEAEMLRTLDLSEWQFEWKWDGIRSQIIKRNGEVFIWTRGEELVTDRYPELAEAAQALPDGTVLDGEILAFKDNQPLSFGMLQKRIGKLNASAALLAEVPVVLVAYDCLEINGTDIREQPMTQRRLHLEQVIGETAQPAFRISENIQITDATQLSTLKEEARSHSAEGLMVKRKKSAYGVGRKRGDWWKWKVVPYSLDAVLIYGQKGHGRRADLFTDYTFGLWNAEGELVPFAKAYSGLTDKEILVVDKFIRTHTKDKFGPVRTVEPEMVFEIAFENIVPSNRHKAKYAVRFPRIVRIRDDKKIEDADTLEALKSLMDAA